MTAQTQYETPTIRAGNSAGIPVAASTSIYNDALVARNASGYLVNAADTAGLIVAGVAELADNSAGANGAISSTVRWGVQVLMNTDSDLSQAKIGSAVYVYDNRTVGIMADVTNGVFAGQLVEYVSSTQAWVYVPGMSATFNPSQLKQTVVAGGAAGDITVTGITTNDRIVSVLHLDIGGNAESDLTSEFSITAADTINNAGGTATSSDTLIVTYVTAA